jgi:hypothetical protein
LGVLSRTALGKYLSAIQDIIIVIGILIGAFLFRKTKPTLIKGILLGLILSMVLPFLSTKLIIINVTYWTFGILTLILAFFNLINKKWLNFMIGFFAFLSFLFALMSWPFYNALFISMIIPFVCYLVVVKNWKLNINQLGVLTILGLYELTLILRIVKQWLV